MPPDIIAPAAPTVRVPAHLAGKGSGQLMSFDEAAARLAGEPGLTATPPQRGNVQQPPPAAPPPVRREPEQAPSTRLAEPPEEPPPQPSGQQGDDPVLYELADGTPVTLSQAEEWRAGALRQDDYTRKTQEIADTRRALDGLRGQLDQGASVIAPYMQHAPAILQHARQVIEALLPTEPDARTAQGDGVAYVAMRDRRQAALQHLAQLDQGIAWLQQMGAAGMRAAQAVHQADAQAKSAEELPKLLEKLPTWRNQAVAQREGAEVRRHLLEEAGYTEDEILRDHRLWLLGRQAVIGGKVVAGGARGGAATAARSPTLDQSSVRAGSVGGTTAEAREIAAANQALRTARTTHDREQAAVRKMVAWERAAQQGQRRRA